MSATHGFQFFSAFHDGVVSFGAGSGAFQCGFPGRLPSWPSKMQLALAWLVLAKSEHHWAILVFEVTHVVHGDGLCSTDTQLWHPSRLTLASSAMVTFHHCLPLLNVRNGGMMMPRSTPCTSLLDGAPFFVASSHEQSD